MASLSGGSTRGKREDALAPVAPISDRTRQCIAFLFEVQRITVADTTTDGNGDSCLVLNVAIADDAAPKASRLADVALAAVAHAAAAGGSESGGVAIAVTADAGDAGLAAAAAGETASASASASASGGSVTTLQILRTFKELKELEKVVTHWSKRHMQLGECYGIPECSYCRHFYARETTKRWPGGALARLATPKRSLEQQFEACVNDYVVHARLPRPSDLECQGFDHIPCVVARFLTKELPIPM